MNISLLRTFLLFALAFSFSKCGTSGQAMKGNTGSDNCSFAWGGQTLLWVPVPDTSGLGLRPEIGKTRLPDTFAVFTIKEQVLASFLEAANTGDPAAQSMKLPIPARGKCVAFRLAPSGILSDELKAKFPGLISLKGTADSDEQITARIDYSPKAQLKVAIHDHHQEYLIAPWPGKEKHYYLVYKKEDAGYERIPYQHY